MLMAHILWIIIHPVWQTDPIRNYYYYYFLIYVGVCGTVGNRESHQMSEFKLC